MSEATATRTPTAASNSRINRIPWSTYRLQLGPDLTLDQSLALLPYLQSLGISDLYLSPLFCACAESSHGYDVVDHGTIDPAIGDLAAFERLATAARKAGMGILLDVVPNHMGINDPGNLWWLDVLENGEGSYFADFFDIEWHPPAAGLQDKILLPFLGEPFGAFWKTATCAWCMTTAACNWHTARGSFRWRLPRGRSCWSLHFAFRRTSEIPIAGRTPTGVSCKASSQN